MYKTEGIIAIANKGLMCSAPNFTHDSNVLDGTVSPPAQFVSAPIQTLAKKGEPVAIPIKKFDVERDLLVKMKTSPETWSLRR